MPHAETPLWILGSGDTLFEYLQQHHPSYNDQERREKAGGDLQSYVRSICDDMVQAAEDGSSKTIASASNDIYAMIQERFPKHLEAQSVMLHPQSKSPKWTGRPYTPNGDGDYTVNPEYRGKPVTSDDIVAARRLLEAA